MALTQLQYIKLSYFWFSLSIIIYIYPHDIPIENHHVLPKSHYYLMAIQKYVDPWWLGQVNGVNLPSGYDEQFAMVC